MNAPASVYSASLMDGIASLDRPKTIAFIAAKTDFGTSTVATAKTYAWSAGLKFVAEEYYQKGQPDLRAILAKVKAAKPDLVFMVSYEADAILLMRQARELKLTPRAFLGAGAGFTTPQFLAQTDISNGVFAATQWTSDVNWKGAKEFEKAYLARFGSLPTYHAACAYESVRVMAEAANTAGGNTERTRNELVFRMWHGIMGTVKFDAYKGYTNQNNHPMLVQQAQGDKYVTVFPKQSASGEPIYPFKWPASTKEDSWFKLW
jgi:branched-chain amino acid transport system substrate-binding protein